MLCYLSISEVDVCFASFMCISEVDVLCPFYVHLRGGCTFLGICISLRLICFVSFMGISEIDMLRPFCVHLRY